MITVLTDTLPISGNYAVEFYECTDPHGRDYAVVTIGQLTWMAENLRLLPFVTSGRPESDRVPYYYVANYTGTDVNVAMTRSFYRNYGVLYNWPAALVSCPEGWHLPSDEEWMMLEMHLGMNQRDLSSMDPRPSGNVGWKLKSSIGWQGSSNGSNSSGFAALPAGYRNAEGSFSDQDYGAYFWTNSESEDTKGWGRSIPDYGMDIKRGTTFRRIGFSVRCVKNL